MRTAHLGQWAQRMDCPTMSSFAEVGTAAGAGAAARPHISAEEGETQADWQAVVTQVEEGGTGAYGSFGVGVLGGGSVTEQRRVVSASKRVLL